MLYICMVCTQYFWEQNITGALPARLLEFTVPWQTLTQLAGWTLRYTAGNGSGAWLWKNEAAPMLQRKHKIEKKKTFYHNPVWLFRFCCMLSTYHAKGAWNPMKSIRKNTNITWGIELINVLELESVQRDRLVQNREGASLFQEMIQFQVLWHPERILLWTDGPLHRKTGHSVNKLWSLCTALHRMSVVVQIRQITGQQSDKPSCFSLSLWSAGIRQTGTGKHRSALCSLVINQRKMLWDFTQMEAMST